MYRTVCLEAAEAMGRPWAHPEISLHTHSLAEYLARLEAGDWSGVAELMLSSADKLARGGADFFVCPDNTIHRALPLLLPRSPKPWLHIAEVVAREAERCGYTRLAILGTRSLMEGPVYPAQLAQRKIDHRIPNPDERAIVDHIIFHELLRAELRAASRARMVAVIERLAAEGCDAVVLGCTEIPLLIAPEDSPLPVLDSTRLLARAALQHALGREA